MESTGNAMSVPVVGAVICAVLQTITNGPALPREPTDIIALNLRSAFPVINLRHFFLQGAWERFAIRIHPA